MKFAHFSHVWGKPGMTPHQRYEQLWRELEHCDDLGFDFCSCVEHHFQPMRVGCLRRHFTRSAAARAPSDCASAPDEIRRASFLTRDMTGRETTIRERAMSLGTVDAILPLGGAPRMGMPRRSRSLSGASLAGTVDDFVIDLDNDALKGLWTLTFGCVIQKLRPGIRTRSHRHTTSSVYYVVRGFGYSIIDGKRFNWTEGDYFALPHRVWHEHANASSSEPAVLFSLADEPAFETLVYRREEHWEQNGSFRQPDV